MAHHPLPRCLGGTETVSLWSSECNYKCFFSTSKQFLVGEWEWLVPYFNYFNTLHITPEVRLKAAAKMQAKTTQEQRSKAGKIGGPIGGRYVRTEETLSKLKAHANSEEGKKTRSMNVSKTNKRRMRCTITGYVGNPGNLGKHQKKLGIDPSNREWVDDSST